MKYNVIIQNQKRTFPIKGLNELLDGKLYNPRTKRYHNPVKKRNDDICRAAIKKYLKGVSFDKQIQCTYWIYAKDKMHDRGNLYAVDKSFLDAMQQAGKIPNDGWKEVADSIFHTEVDKNNPRIEVEVEEIDCQ